MDTCTSGFADSAMAVPLRNASAGGRPENTNAHGAGKRDAAPGRHRGPARPQRLAVVQVGSYLGAELDNLETWLDPLHKCLLLVCGLTMKIEVTAADPYAIGADLVAAGAGPRASELGAPDRALTEGGGVAVVYAGSAPLAVVAVEPDLDGLRTAAARAVRACRNGGTVAWALDVSLPLPVDEHVRALAEGAVIGSYESPRARSTSAQWPRGRPSEATGPAAGEAASRHAASSAS